MSYSAPLRRASNVFRANRSVVAVTVGAAFAFAQPAAAQDSPCCTTDATTAVDAGNLIPTTPTGADCGGDDELQGSRSTISHYTDVLSGDEDDDLVCGLAGDDIGNGNGGADLVCGDNDDDTLSGGGGPDTCCGYGGYNVLTGEGDGDELNYGSSGTNDGGIGNDKCTNGTGDPNCEANLVGDECPT